MSEAPRIYAPVRCEIRSIVSDDCEQYAVIDVGVEVFKQMRERLREKCPTGDLHIHLYVDVPEPE